MKHATEFFAKTLTSRKFWATVAAVITFGLAGEWHNAGLAIVAYTGVQGTVDAAEKFRGSKPAAELEGSTDA